MTTLLTLLALIAFASNSLLARVSLGAGEIDAATFTAIRLLAGAAVLGALVRVRDGAWTALRGGGVLGPITLFVYVGADGSFTLYEDDGVSYGYERGASARIPIRWNDASRTLAIGARDGAFPGMLASRTFNVVVVDAKHPVGFSFDPKPVQTLRYDGTAQDVRLP